MADVVIAPLVIAKDEQTGVPNYYYEGTVVPDSVSAEDRKRFRDEGLTEAPKKAKESKSAPDDGEAGAPAKSASKADWKAYAISQGMSEDDAEASTRDKLAEQYNSSS